MAWKYEQAETARPISDEAPISRDTVIRWSKKFKNGDFEDPTKAYIADVKNYVFKTDRI